MEKFYNIIKKPLLIAIIATALYLIDAFIGGLFIESGSFLWIAFIFWTIFFGSTTEERIRGFIGTIIGFLCACLMMLVTNSFTVNILTINLSCLLSVFVFNFLVMFLDHTKKFWTNSITGVFAGIGLTFSGLGKGLVPVSSWGTFGIMLAILSVYCILGMLAGFFSIYQKKSKKEKDNATK